MKKSSRTTMRRTTKHKVARNNVTKKTTTVTLNLDALVKRINTRLKTDSQMLRVARGKTPDPTLGRFYTVDMFDRNTVMRSNLDVIKMGWDYQLLTDGMVVTEMHDSPFGKVTVKQGVTVPRAKMPTPVNMPTTPTPTPTPTPMSTANMSAMKSDRIGRHDRATDRDRIEHDRIETKAV